MIIDIVNKMLKYVMIIAFVSLISTMIFNIQNVLITESTYNGITIKTVDFRLYLNNLSNSFQTTALNFDTILPTRQWDDTGAWNNWDPYFNNLAFLFDWTYFPINFILYILRWIAWILRLVLALIGWNIGINEYGEYYSVLAKILSWINQNLMIPYV